MKVAFHLRHQAENAEVEQRSVARKKTSCVAHPVEVLSEGLVHVLDARKGEPLALADAQELADAGHPLGSRGVADRVHQKSREATFMKRS